jgi:hypothetical protein
MTATNGWPGKPGVPLNPEKDGWHWIKPKISPKRGIQLIDESASRPMPWNIVSPLSHKPAWNGVMEPEHAANAWQYLGPCLTPAEVEARVKEARRDALEEAAQWHDQQASEAQRLSDIKVSALDSKVWGDYAQNHREYAAAIRALKGEGDE